MNESSASEHWFDRLATAMTRRTALKAGLAATAAMALPLWRSPRAAAVINVDPCTNGCLHFAQQQAGRAAAHCQTKYEQNEPGLVLTGLLFSFSNATLILPGLFDESQYNRCLDKTVIASKVAQYDCYQPDCTGFDPKQPGGPCDTCDQNCCTCPGIPNGYICCFYDCADTNHNCCGS